MAVSLGKQIKGSITVGAEEVTFTFRQPSNAELNQFLNARYQMGRRARMQDNSIEERARFFDLLLVDIENLVDAEGAAVGPDRKDLVPLNWKSGLIFTLFEDAEVSEKN